MTAKSGRYANDENKHALAALVLSSIVAASWILYWSKETEHSLKGSVHIQDKAREAKEIDQG